MAYAGVLGFDFCYAVFCSSYIFFMSNFSDTFIHWIFGSDFKIILIKFHKLSKKCSRLPNMLRSLFDNIKKQSLNNY